MQAMRRYVHTVLAALLCMCLLVSYTPLPASAGQASRPSVSDEVDQARPTGDGQAQLGTTVNVLAVASPAILQQTEDFAASVAQISGNAMYDLKVVATGQGELSYAWTRTANGQPDASFSFDEGPAYPLSQHADTLQDGTVYVYTVAVRDGVGSVASASITVAVGTGYEYRTVDSADAEGVSVSAWMHYAAVLHAAQVDPVQPTFGLLQAAADAPLAAAFHIDLVAEGAAAFVGRAEVALPAPGVPDGAATVVGIGADGRTMTLAAQVEGGTARFSTEVLGAFAAAYADPAASVHAVTATAGKGGQITPAGEVKVADGGSVTFMALPDAGFAVDKVLVDGVPTAAPGGVCALADVREDRTVQALFHAVDPDPTRQHAVSAQVAGGNGAVSVNNGVAGAAAQAQVAHGERAVIALFPDAGWTVDAVTIDDGSGAVAMPALNGACTIAAVESDVRVQVSFKPGAAPPAPTFTVTASAGEGGSVAPSEVRVPFGGSTEFEVVADKGYVLESLTVDGGDAMGRLSGTVLSVQNVVSDRAVEASFERDPAARTHTVTASASSGGSVSPSGRVDVQEGGSATFEFRPDAGYMLARVLLDGRAVDAAEIADGSYTISDVQADHAVRGEFAREDAPEPAYAVVHVSAGEGGSASPAGDVRVAPGGRCAIVLLPDEGCALDAVTVDGQDATDRVEGGRLVLDAVTAETWVRATFRSLGQGEPQPDVPQVHALHASSTSGGTISPRGRTLVAHGEDATFAVAANEGYRLASVLVDGAELDAAQTEQAVRTGALTVAGVVADRSVRAVFERVPGGPAPEESPTVNVDVEVKVSVTSGGSAEGGSVQPESLTVPRGARDVAFFAYPEQGYVLESVAVNGEPTEFHPLAAAPAADTLRSRAAVFAAADGQAGGYWFSIAEAREDAMVDVVFRPRTADDPEPAPVTTHRVETSASAGGAITPSMTVPEGRDALLAVMPDAGFKLASLTVEEGGVPRNALGEVAGGMLVLRAVSADAKVSAVFAPDVEPPRYTTLHAASGGHGAISPEGDVRVLRGADQTFSLIPDDGYTVDQVTVDGVPVVVSGFSLTVPNVQADAEVRVTFREATATDPEKPAYHAVAASATVGGSVHPSGAVQVAHGSAASFSFLPDEGFELANVTLDGANLPAHRWRDGTLRLDDVQRDHAVRAVFEKTVPPAPGKVRVTTEPGEGGRIEPAGPFDVDEGINLMFSFIPDAGFELDTVKVNGAVKPVVNSQFELMGISEDTVVSATFKETSAPPMETHVVTASVAGNKGGEIVPKGPIEVPHGGSQLFTFKPAEGYVLDAVLVDGEREEPARPDGALPYYLMKNVTADRSIAAVFRAEGGEPPVDPVKFTITAGVSGGHGSIEPAGAVRVDAGGSRTFQFRPDDGYRVAAVVIDGARLPFDGSSYPFVNVRADHSILVEFAFAAPPAPSGPFDAAGRGVQTAIGYVKTGDAAGPLACAAAALALAAAGVAAASRRRDSKGGRP